MTTGGKTVKNVAGYDLCKLFVGSLGTLGAICEVTLRLAPIAEARAMLVAALDRATAGSVAGQLLSSRLEMGSLDIANCEAARAALPSLPVTLRPEAWVLCIGVMGEETAIGRQEREIRGLSPQGLARIDGEDAEAIWRALGDAGYPRQGAPAAARLSLPPAYVEGAVDFVSSWDGWWTVARAGDGLVYAGPPSDSDLSETAQRLIGLRQWAAERQGFARLEWGPAELKQEFPVWGTDLPNLDLMARIKESYDRGRNLGCGRYLPGL